MPISAQIFVQQGLTLLPQLQGMLTNLTNSFPSHQKKLTELQNALAQALEELVYLNIPKLSTDVFEQVRKYTGYAQFQVKDPFVRMEEERQTLLQIITNIEADERYCKREELINSQTGELIIKADQVRDPLNIMQSAVQRYEEEEGFFQLIGCGYGTDAYPYKVWNLEYYTHWKIADSLAEKFNFKNFEEVRTNYFYLSKERDEILKELKNIENEIDQVKKLETLLEESKYRLNNLSELTLQDCRHALNDHLKYLDRGQLFEWSKGDIAREALVKKIDGLEKKINYLEQMTNHQMENEKEELQSTITKLTKKIEKYKRPKNAYMQISDADAAQWLTDPRTQLSERRNHFLKDYDRIVVFDHYDRYDYAGNILWWDLMSDGRINGNFIPEVREYYSVHPYTYSRGGFISAGSTFSSSDYNSSLVEVS